MSTTTEETQPILTRKTDGVVVTTETNEYDAEAQTSETQKQSEEQQRMKKNARSVMYLGFCFCFLFSTIFPCKIMIPPLFRRFGMASLAIMSGSMGFTSFFLSSYLILKLGIKGCIFIGGFSYYIYISCVVFENSHLMLVMAIFGGFGSGLLWVAQGVFIATLAKDTPKYKGYLTGLFFTIFNCNFFGYSIMGALLLNGFSIRNMMYVMIGLGLIPNILILFLRNIDQSIEAEPISQTIRKTASMCTQTDMWLLVFCVVCQGIMTAYSQGIFPEMLSDVSVRQVPTIFIGFGVCAIVGAYLFGWALDYFGWKFVVVLHSLVLFSALILVVVCRMYYKEKVIFYYVIAILLGTSDAIFRLVNAWAVPHIFPDKMSEAHSMIRSTLSVSSVIGYCVRLLSHEILATYVVMGFAVFGMVARVVLHVHVIKKEEEEEI